MSNSTRPDVYADAPVADAPVAEPTADHPPHPSAEAALAGPAKGSTAAIDDPPPEHFSPSLREALFGEERLLEQERLTRRSRWSNWTVLAMLVLCFFVLVRFPSRGARPVGRHFEPAASQRLDMLRLQPLGGTAQIDLADLGGRVAVLVFFSPADERCRRELPALFDSAGLWTDRPAVRLLPVACPTSGNEDPTELFNQTQDYLREYGLSMRVYTDPDGVSRRAASEAVELDRMPTLLLLDRSGRIRAAWQGLDAESARDIGDQVDKVVQGE